MTGEERLINLLTSFTSDGSPLPALVGTKLENHVVCLTAAMLANENLASSMEPEEMVDAAINFVTIIQQRINCYEASKVHSLERLLDR